MTGSMDEHDREGDDAMTDADTSKAAWLDRLAGARETWEAIVAEAGEAGMDRPGAAGAWTFKDVAGHLNGWRERTVDRLEAGVRDEPPMPPPWPAGLDDETDEGLEAINGWIHERNRGRPAVEVVAESRAQFERMQTAVEAVSEADLTTPGRFPWLDGEPLWAVLEGTFYHLHGEHEPALRAWLADRAG